MEVNLLLTKDMFEFSGPYDLEQILDSTKILIAHNGECQNIECIKCPFGVGHMKSNIYRALIREDGCVCFSAVFKPVRLDMARQFLALFSRPQPTKINLTE